MFKTTDELKQAIHAAHRALLKGEATVEQTKAAAAVLNAYTKVVEFDFGFARAAGAKVSYETGCPGVKLGASKGD